MKANVWSNTELREGNNLTSTKDDLRSVLGSRWLEFGKRKDPKAMERDFEQMLHLDARKISDGPMERGKDLGRQALEQQGGS